MTDFNLPPGCRDRDLPGSRPNPTPEPRDWRVTVEVAFWITLTCFPNGSGPRVGLEYVYEDTVEAADEDGARDEAKRWCELYLDGSDWTDIEIVDINVTKVVEA